MSPTQPRIAIVGGGPAGFTALLTLHKRGIPATLYEREVSATSRSHLGGTIDLHWNYGQRAFRENGLREVFDSVSRPEADEYHIAGKDGVTLVAIPASRKTKPEEFNPEIDRPVLRKIMIDAVPPESIKWGHALASVRALGGGEHELTFTNGTTTVCDLLIGADGGQSRVRPLVSPAERIYTGINGAEISLAPGVIDREDMADLGAAIGKGTLFARTGTGRVRTYPWFLAPEDWKLPEDPSAARAALRERFATWSPVLLKLIDHADDAAVYQRALYMLPVDHTWTHVDGVTIVGDAAHLMTPFSGMGGNVAMLGALEMGIAVADAINAGATREEREAAIAACEASTFKKAQKWAQKTFEGQEKAFQEGTPGKLMDEMNASAVDKND
ncbi:FAD/NAD-P-binding domain-containing protein [Epithele typhae]|uniref:FAD/NAD-P-binding domain-containing protein n=1 Tax=Epithele typhae TaxID=378194 RepID=UPI0020083BE0|nr:FAD/NAD-P-binding domain-containing protein [Epithele typhae]KAH9935991.1 FAD/NAD-P-binding domain-containing protein [Epithele typhae]